MARVSVALALAALLGACSAEIKVSELPSDAQPGTTVNGVPFRTKERYLVKVYRKSEDGYQQVYQQMETLPNPDRVYVLEHLGQLLSNTETKFVLQRDGTLDSVDLAADSQLDEALVALGEQVQATGTTIEEIRTARAAEKTAEETELQQEETAAVDYQTALNAATEAEAQLAELPAESPASTVLAQQNRVKLLKLQANIAARRAGLPRPFPEVGV